MWIELHLYGTGERALININTIRGIIEGKAKSAYIALSGDTDIHVSENYDDVVNAIIRRNYGGVE
jgi:hypothetical protein